MNKYLHFVEYYTKNIYITFKSLKIVLNLTYFFLFQLKTALKRLVNILCSAWIKKNRSSNAVTNVYQLNIEYFATFHNFYLVLWIMRLSWNREKKSLALVFKIGNLEIFYEILTFEKYNSWHFWTWFLKFCLTIFYCNCIQCIDFIVVCSISAIMFVW